MGKSLLLVMSQNLLLKPFKKIIFIPAFWSDLFLKGGKLYIYVFVTRTMNSFSTLCFAAKLIYLVIDKLSVSIRNPG